MSFEFNMKVKCLYLSVLYLFISSCEDVEIAYPGNNQSTKAVAPSGTADWLIDYSSNNIGQLPENSVAGLPIACLLYTSPSPRD